MVDLKLTSADTVNASLDIAGPEIPTRTVEYSKPAIEPVIAGSTPWETLGKRIGERVTVVPHIRTSDDKDDNQSWVANAEDITIRGRVSCLLPPDRTCSYRRVEIATGNGCLTRLPYDTALATGWTNEGLLKLEAYSFTVRNRLPFGWLDRIHAGVSRTAKAARVALNGLRNK